MKKFFSVLVIGFFLTSLVYGAGITKHEMSSKDAGSAVLYGTSDSGDSIVRVKTDADGTINATISGTYTGPLSVSQNSDTVAISHDGTDAYFKTSDGTFYFQTDEGTNTDTIVRSVGKGTGSGLFYAKDGSNASYWTQFGQEESVFTFKPGSAVTEIVFNESSADVNFRVESDNNANCFIVDAGTDTVQIQGKNSIGQMTELTINADGAITVTSGFHLVDTYEDAATDDLQTISGGVTGMILVLRGANSARDVTLKDGVGNLSLAGDFTFSNVSDTMMLIYNGSLWQEISRSDNA